MDLRLLPILAVLAVAAFAAPGSQAQVPDVFEVDEANGNISATYNGSPLSLNVTGPQDNWTIQLPGNIVLTFPTTDILFGEPDNGSLLNEVKFLASRSPQFMTWTSDVPNPGPPDTSGTVFFHDAGFNSDTGDSFDLLLADKGDTAPVKAPDSASSACLLFVATCALILFGRRINRVQWVAT